MIPLRADNKAVIVHEWGTFTSLQDENGQAIGGINVDDEPVPGFVWGWGGVKTTAGNAFPVGGFGLPPWYGGKGWMPGDQDVTMRLETPVLYFYPPKGQTPQSVPPLTVHVDFQAGFLSQYYPYAEVNGSPGKFPFEILKDQRLSEVTSGLTWKDVRLGSTAKPVETDDKVWTTPREVSAPLLQVTQPPAWNGQSQDSAKPQAEHFLFYRGVGHLDSLLRLRMDVPSQIRISDHPSPGQSALFDEGWLVEIHSDGSCAFRTKLGGSAMVEMGGCVFSPIKPAAFSEDEFNTDNLVKLKASMQDALVKEGLYPDEASAMLRTWELSYFKSPGLRFFYLVPRVWVDKTLPLKITGAQTDISRVMIGRIELISDAQKAALARLAAGPCPDLAAVKKAAQDALQNSKLPKADADAFYRGEKPLSELGIAIPPLVQDYLSLGRFRDALIVHEQQQHPSPALAQFIKDNGLAAQSN